MNPASHAALKQKRAQRLRLPAQEERFIEAVKASAQVSRPPRQPQDEDLPSFLPPSRHAALSALIHENMELHRLLASLDQQQLAGAAAAEAAAQRNRTVLDVNRQVALQFIADQHAARHAALLGRAALAREQLRTLEATAFAALALAMAQALQALLVKAMAVERSVGAGLRGLRREIEDVSHGLAGGGPAPSVQW